MTFYPASFRRFVSDLIHGPRDIITAAEVQQISDFIFGDDTTARMQAQIADLKEKLALLTEANMELAAIAYNAEAEVHAWRTAAIDENADCCDEDDLFSWLETGWAR